MNDTLFDTDPALIVLAEDWARRNPAAWALVKQWADDDFWRNRRCSMAFYVELLRRPEYHTAVGTVTEASDGQCYRIPNALRAPLVRLLVREKPYLAHSFITRHSDADA